MKALSFLPLIIWAVGWVAVGCWDSHLRAKDGRKDSIEKNEKNAAIIWLFGVLFFSLIGVASW